MPPGTPEPGVGGVCAEPGFYLCFRRRSLTKQQQLLGEAHDPRNGSATPKRDCHISLAGAGGPSWPKCGLRCEGPCGPSRCHQGVLGVCCTRGCSRAGLASAQTVVPVCGVGGHASQGCFPWRRLSSRHLAQPASWSMCIRVVLCPGEEHGLGIGQTLVCPVFGQQEGVGSGL